MRIDKTPIIADPELLDRIIGEMQVGLSQSIGWLDHVFGRAERLVSMSPERRRIYLPNVYVGGNEYMQIGPDSNIGNFAFFWVDDPQTIQKETHQSVAIKTPFSLIVWFDYRTVYNSPDVRNKEKIKKQIIDALNGGFLLKKGSFSISRIYELAENIYRGFTLDEIDNQFLMHPYGGFRFEGTLYITESCA